MSSKITASGIVAALAVAFFLALPVGTFAHTIPNSVTIEAFMKPSGQSLMFLVRVPLNAMTEGEFPLRGPGYLDLPRVDHSLHDAAELGIARNIAVFEGDTLLPEPKIVETRVALQSDMSFATYEQALAHVTGPRLGDDVSVDPSQALLDVLLEYPIQSDHSYFSIRTQFSRLGIRVVTILRFLPADGTVRSFEFLDDPGLVRLDPRWYQVAGHFLSLGFSEILGGTDYLLFLLCLVIPFRRLGALIPITFAFTASSCVTFIASAYNWAPNYLWFPPLISTLIAVSILYVALEDIIGLMSVQRRWMITLVFGLVYGFSFSFAFRQMLQFAGTHMLTSALSFNIGVVLGQLLVLALLVPALELLFRLVLAERMGTIILSALVAHRGWHWMIDRWAVLNKFPIQLPALDAALLASAMFWLMLLVALGGLIWLVFGVLRYRAERSA